MAALRSPGVNALNFRYGALHVSPRTLSPASPAISVGRLVDSGDIEASKYDQSSPKSGATYFHREDRIAMGGNSDPSMVIHEAVHALQDLRRFPTDRKDAEATAFLAQIVYQYWSEKQTSPAAFVASKRGIDKAAATVAKRLGMLTRPGVPTIVTTGDIAPIRGAVANHSLYKNSSKSIDWNGIRRR